MKVELRPKFMELSFNIMVRMIAGKRYYGKDVVDEEARQFQGILRESMELHGSSNLGDYFPFFQWVDIQGVQKRMMRLMKKMDKFFQFLIDEHRKIRTKSNVSLGESSGSAKERKKKTLIDVMLSLQRNEAEGRIWAKFYLKI